MQVNIKKLDDAAITPSYQTQGAAGFDIHALDGGIVYTGDTVVVRTGLVMEVPEGHVLLVFPRSGLATKSGVVLANTVGVVDSDYRGEVKLVIHLRDMNDAEDIRYSYHADTHYFSWDAGERLAQGVIVPCVQAQFNEVDELSTTKRGAGGFGSTGKGRAQKRLFSVGDRVRYTGSGMSNHQGVVLPGATGVIVELDGGSVPLVRFDQPSTPDNGHSEGWYVFEQDLEPAPDVFSVGDSVILNDTCTLPVAFPRRVRKNATSVVVAREYDTCISSDMLLVRLDPPSDPTKWVCRWLVCKS